MMRPCVPLGVGLLAITMVAGGTPPAQAQGPVPAKRHSKLGEFLFKPPPSVIDGVETPASRMARWSELGGGFGTYPGYTNGDTQSYFRTFWLPAGGADPSLSPKNRARVLDRYYGRGGWSYDAYGRAVANPGRVGFLTPASPGPSLGGGMNIGLPY